MARRAGSRLQNTSLAMSSYQKSTTKHQQLPGKSTGSYQYQNKNIHPSFSINLYYFFCFCLLIFAPSAFSQNLLFKQITSFLLVYFASLSFFIYFNILKLKYIYSSLNAQIKHYCWIKTHTKKLHWLFISVFAHLSNRAFEKMHDIRLSHLRFTNHLF